MSDRLPRIRATLKADEREIALGHGKRKVAKGRRVAGAARPGRARRAAPARNAADEVRILYDTVRDLGATLSVSEVIGRLVDRAREHLGAARGCVVEANGDGVCRIALARGLSGGANGGAADRLCDGVAGWVLAKGRPLLVPDVARDRRFRHAEPAMRSCVAAPLHSSERKVVGAVLVADPLDGRPFGPDDLRLLRAIARQASVALANARQHQETLERAQRDPLTEVANRGHFWEVFELELARARRYGRALSLVLVDVDDFKRYNDALGHLEGDRALAALARVMEQASRKHDLVARVGGEEFAVLLPETACAGAAAFAEKIRDRVRREQIGVEFGMPLRVSLGVASFPDHAQEPPALFATADRELYRAKDGGRDRVCVASECCTRAGGRALAPSLGSASLRALRAREEL
jgi:diguanylate cyclase (GGDEF)-like protein